VEATDVISHHRVGELIVVTVALSILVTLGLQASTKGWLARRLGLIEAPEATAALSSEH
jgi:NhaP-type Na+/H+ or K+/H+ antiporter